MPATTERREEKERIRHDLLRATLRLAAAHGFASLGLREVSRKAGIAPTSFYRHFADMDELGGALIRDLVGPVIRNISQGMRTTSAERGDVLVTMVDAMLRKVADDPELMRFLIAERCGAFKKFRGALRTQLTDLTIELLANCAHSLSTQAADAAIVLLLDACDIALDGEPAQHAALRDALLGTLQTLTEETNTGREV